MSGPQSLKSLIAALGLLLMLPLGYALVTSTVTPTDAAVRAAALFVAVAITRKMADLAPSGRTVLIPATDDDALEDPEV